jgi:hypothetical protein
MQAQTKTSLKKLFFDLKEAWKELGLSLYEAPVGNQFEKH